MKATDTVEQQVVARLTQDGPQSLEQLSSTLRTVSWVELVLALDRLSRTQDIELWRTETGQYRISQVFRSS
jgi:hypothetical protein